jgi:bacteriocin biosynthesis cyclodehydratase domain-containing protein
VLERHPLQVATAESPEGPPPERPLLAPWLRRADVDGSILLEYADEIVVLDGPAAPSLLLLLDGRHALDELAPAEREGVRLLASAGVVVSGPATTDEEALRESALGGPAPAFAADRLATAWVALAGEGTTADELERLLPGRVRRIDWDDSPEGVDLAIAAPSPGELPLLRDWNEQLLATRTAWLLVLPFNGRFAAVGPLFVPGETCCYDCLVRRRAAALPDPADFVALESAPAAYPVGPSLSAVLAGMAAVAATRWLVRRETGLGGVLVAVEPDEAFRTTTHRVLRVPRCASCSPACGEPPLVPWANALTR